MPLTLMELYRAEMDPICPQKENYLQLAHLPVSVPVFTVQSKSLLLYPRLGGWGWGKFRSLCISRSCSPSGQYLPRSQLCLPYSAAHGASPVPAFPVSPLPSHYYRGWLGWPNNRAGLACPAVYLLPSDAEPFCGFSRSCWSWGESPSCLCWCLGCFSLSPAPVLLCSVWVLNAPDECSHLKTAGM